MSLLSTVAYVSGGATGGQVAGATDEATKMPAVSILWFILGFITLLSVLALYFKFFKKRT